MCVFLFACVVGWALVGVFRFFPILLGIRHICQSCESKFWQCAFRIVVKLERAGVGELFALLRTGLLKLVFTSTTCRTVKCSLTDGQTQPRVGSSVIESSPVDWIGLDQIGLDWMRVLCYVVGEGSRIECTSLQLSATDV